MGLFGRRRQANQLGQFDLRHLLGLDLPETPVRAQLSARKLVLSTGELQFALSLERVTAAEYRIELDLRQYSEAGVPGSLAGAMAFDLPGDGLPWSAAKRLVRNCAVISFLSFQGMSSLLLLQDEVPESQQAAALVEAMRPLMPPTQ